MNQDNTKPGPEGMKGSWRDRLGINKELPKIAEEFKEPPQKAQAAETREPPQEKPPLHPARAPLAKPAPMAPRPNAAEFSERLRQQREAAERMAEQRVAEAKDRAINEQRPQAPQQRNAAPPPRPAAPAAKPRFGFAEEELRNERQEPPAPRENPPRQWNSGQSASVARPVFTADRQGAPADPRLRAPPPQRAPAAPQARNLPPTQQGRVPPPPRPSRPGAPQPMERLRRTSSADDSNAQDEPYRRAQRQAEMPRSRNEIRGAHSRELDHVDEESDDLFEDEQSYSAEPRRRATAQDYGQAYREFDGEPQERRRTGPFLLIAALVTVGAIAGGLIYFYQTSTGNQATSAGNIPVLDEPSAPVKTQPETAATAEDPAPPTQDQSMASTPEMQAPQAAQKKQIYDRILGETTLEEQEQVVPSEEQPVPPQSGQSQGFDADPLPLPLPPSPGGGTDDQSGSLEPPGPPTSVAGVKASSETSSEQAAPASAMLATEPAEQSEPDEQSEPAEQSEAALAPPPAPAAADEPEASPPMAPEPVQAEKQPEPIQSSETAPAPAARQKAPAAEKKINNELAFAEQPAVAPSKPQGDGPVQIAQLPGFNASSETTTTFAPVPQALPDLDQGSSTTQRRARPIGTRESDKVVVNPNRNFNRARQVQVAQIEPDPFATQSVSQAPAVTQVPSQPEPQPATVQQQAAVEPAPAPAQPRVSHGTGTGFTIQLASYKSEADALAGYEQLRLQHGQLVGSLAPNIQKADLGANGTFYRLHLGSFASKDAARKACSSLLAAGERDCIVKSR